MAGALQLVFLGNGLDLVEVVGMAVIIAAGVWVAVSKEGVGRSE
jgi:hypothetical protein